MVANQSFQIPSLRAARSRSAGAAESAARAVQLLTKPTIHRQKPGAADQRTDSAPSARRRPSTAATSAPGAANGITWLGTRCPALPTAQPPSIGPWSTTVTARPRPASSNALESPTIPPPITTTSLFDTSFIRGLLSVAVSGTSLFHGCLPALMTPCDAAGRIDPDALVGAAVRLVAAGMSGVVYCGSMGDWPLLSDAQRQDAVERLVAAGVPVVVGTGAPSPAQAADHAAHAASVGAAGLMVIPRVLSRGASAAAQHAHFARVLDAAPDLPAVIYNSPYYGFETRAELFFELRREHPNLIGYKEFGGRQSLTYAAEHITSASDDLLLLVGVDTQVVHGIVYCGAAGVITGIGNVLPEAVLTSIRLAKAGAGGDPTALRLALELERALGPLAEFDERPDLVLFYKHLAVLAGHAEYEHHVNPADALSESQRRYATAQWERFCAWWNRWDGRHHELA